MECAPPGQPSCFRGNVRPPPAQALWERWDTLNYMAGDGDERQRYIYLRGYSLVGKAQLIISALLLMWVMFGNPSIAMLGAGLAGGIVVSVVLSLASVVWRHYKG